MGKKKIIFIAIAVIFALLIGMVVFIFTGSISYEIVDDSKLIGSFDIEDAMISSYNISEKDGEYYLIICYGEQNVFYSTVEISNVKINGKVVVVDVNLPEDEGTLEAFSYPKTAIKFNKKPLFVKVNFE